MKEMKNKLKRKHVQWFIVLKQKGDAKLERDFIDYLGKLYKGTHLSLNRCAYYALKKYYHTTTIEELREVLGL